MKEYTNLLVMTSGVRSVKVWIRRKFTQSQT